MAKHKSDKAADTELCDEPAPEPQADPPTPEQTELVTDKYEILVFALRGGFIAGVISAARNKGSNIAERVKTLMVLSTTQETLEQRCKNALIAEYGLTQEDADVVVPGQMSQLSPEVPPDPEPAPEDVPGG
jgi:hypothetical protein